VLRDLKTKNYLEYVRIPRTDNGGRETFYRCVRYLEDYPRPDEDTIKDEYAVDPRKGLLVDIALEPQIYRVVCDAGLKGITLKEICASLNNISEKLINAAITRLSNQASKNPKSGKTKKRDAVPVTAQYENVGRVRRYRYFSTQILLEGEIIKEDVVVTGATTTADAISSAAVELPTDSGVFAPSASVDLGTPQQTPEDVRVVEEPKFVPVKAKKQIKIANFANSSVSLTAKVRREKVLECLEADKVLSAEQCFFTRVQQLIGTKYMIDKKTIMRDIEALHKDKKLVKHVASIYKPSGAKVVKTIIMHQDLTLESQAVKDFLEEMKDSLVYKTGVVMKSEKVELDSPDFEILKIQEKSKPEIKETYPVFSGSHIKDQLVMDLEKQDLKVQDIQAQYGYVTGKLLRARIMHGIMCSNHRMASVVCQNEQHDKVGTSRPYESEVPCSCVLPKDPSQYLPSSDWRQC
jgi:hypothetical protein